MAKRKTKTIPSIPEPVRKAETQEQKQARATTAGEAVRKILEQYHVTLIVTSLNIETGRILPTIEVVAKDLPL